MHIKSGVKIGLLSLLVVVIITTGIIMFQKLSHDKGVFETDLYTHIPAEVTGILQINKEKNTKVFTPFFPELENVIQTIESSLTYPILIAEQKEDIYIISKITSEQESRIKTLLNINLYPAFAPKTRTYKDAKLFFYPADNNRFFSCMFYQGFFIGGYNYTLLEHFVDTDSSNNIFSNKSATEIAKQIKTSYPANLYFNNKTFFTSFNIDLEHNLIELEGFTSIPFSNNWPNQAITDNDSIAIDYSIFPDSLISYQVDTNAASISSSLICLFDAPSYGFILNEDQASPIYALKHKDDRFDIYNHLNKLEVNYIQRRFSTRDRVLGNQHIYMTSEQMGRDIFHHDSSVYLAFYKDYLLVSADRDIMLQYLKSNGNYKPNVPLDPISISIQTVSLFFSNNIQKFHPDYLNNYYLIKKMGKDQAYFKTYIENGEKKIEIVLNN
ncbi:hypothetical protein CLV62_10860 [Dysgonomonas alginatilytica]|uniref:DUF3352 domain-containing protein n=1 Tax=Dysgonomonas alginatilytica TaxID=1605892 RepID=A0A2V3PPM5_9BACT|nr:hypothetical protein [Dysgonomonas alginatilytica]PXV65062.1 hypothetical protein CLV62_10860 [Dysgonomonas alginatilytica]